VNKKDWLMPYDPPFLAVPSMNPFVICPDRPVTIQRLREAGGIPSRIALSEEALRRIIRCREYLDRRLAGQQGPVYGINTGFGALCNQSIGQEDLETLQRNLLLSHACGMGDEVPDEIVKLMLLLKVQALSYGHSGVKPETAMLLCELYNRGISPVIRSQGSLGASGDLAPLSHLALPLIGEGMVRLKGELMPARQALKSEELSPVVLTSKEGLALINGTQFMSAFLGWILLRSAHLTDYAGRIGALSADAFGCRTEPFENLTHAVRPHPGQIRVAAQIAELLSQSGMAQSAKPQVQDPYSFRCIPQVHGATADALDYTARIWEVEVNSVTDNPIIFPEEDKIISGGNFHGQPLALSLDFAAIALAELGSISERRTYKLLSGQRGLPPFLAREAGLNSGFMICQYTAASIVSQSKQLCSPASVDSIDSSNGQEDHVSMGANAATKALRVLENLQSVLAIEWLTAAQAIEFRRPLRTSPVLESMVAEMREAVPFAPHDILMSDALSAARALLSGTGRAD
jgi:histidine ammonia-lyase